MKLKVMDVVRTKRGALTVVEDVGVNGSVAIVLPRTSLQKVAWYSPDELEYIGSLKELCAKRKSAQG